MLKYKKGFHRHHIIPKYAGGSDDDSNMVYLTKEEHIAAHQQRYEDLGDYRDRCAVLLLRNHEPDKIELAEWRSKNAKVIALLAHSVKLENGFYDRLGKLNSERLKGKVQDVQLESMVKAISGSIWWNNGIKNVRSKESPGDGFVKGRLSFMKEDARTSMSNKMKSKKWYNNGTTSIRSEVHPGDQWVPGRLKIEENKQ